MVIVFVIAAPTLVAAAYVSVDLLVADVNGVRLGFIKLLYALLAVVAHMDHAKTLLLVIVVPMRLVVVVVVVLQLVQLEVSNAHRALMVTPTGAPGIVHNARVQSFQPMLPREVHRISLVMDMVLVTVILVFVLVLMAGRVLHVIFPLQLLYGAVESLIPVPM